MSDIVMFVELPTLDLVLNPRGVLAIRYSATFRQTTIHLRSGEPIVVAGNQCQVILDAFTKAARTVAGE